MSTKFIEMRDGVPHYEITNPPKPGPVMDEDKDKMLSAIREGRQAYADGKDRGENPYVGKGSLVLQGLWEDGWIAGLRCSSENEG